MGLFDQLLAELSHMDLKNFIVVALLFYVPFHFSRKAETLFFHLLYSFFGIYLLLTMEDVRIIYDLKMEVGLGLLIPQISFIIYFTKDMIETIKSMSANTYYFFVTLYYKILRFIHWVQSVINMLMMFLGANGSKQQKDNRSQKENNYQKQEERYSGFQQKQKQEKNEEEAKSSKSEQNNHQRQEIPKRETKRDYGAFERFYDDNAYIVLGVSANDDLRTIKRAYRTLVRQYHPDLNLDNAEQYTEIMQKLNHAYEKLEKYHK